MNTNTTQNKTISTVAKMILAVTGIMLSLSPLSANAATPASVGTKAPALISGTWSNGKPTELSSLKGKVVLLSFWTTACINCRRTVPYWNNWSKTLGNSNDFAVVSVHTPETKGERPISVSRNYAHKNGVTFPVLVDNDAKNWDAFGIQAWPTTILIDKKGIVRGRWEGELNWDNSGEYKTVEAQIQQLRKEPAK